MEAHLQDADKNSPAAAPAAPAKIYLFFTNPESAELLSFALSSYFVCELQTFTSAAPAVAALQNSKPTLLILDGSRSESAVILETAKNQSCKVAVYHPQKQNPAMEGLDLAGVFQENDLLPGVRAVLKQMSVPLKDATESAVQPEVPYFRVGVPLLLRTNPLVADIYLRLSPLKYVKLFHKGASFGHEDVKKYHDTKKIEFFYVRQEDAEQITAKLNGMLEDLLRQNNVPASVTTPISLATIETMHSLVKQVGFTPEVARMVKNSTELVLKEMYASPTLSSILKNLNMDKEKYIPSHSHMLAEVACALSIAMQWDSETSFKKLTMAALLHDMGLSNHKLARVKDLNELHAMANEFSASDLEDYRSHTRRASVLVRGFKEVPADVDKIIHEHHELPMGTGFPEQINHVRIHPLASLIMVAHDLVDWVIDHPSPEPDFNAFVEAHSEKYKMGNFRKILKAIYTLQD